MSDWIFSFSMLLLLFACASTKAPSVKKWNSKEMKLVWADEFDYSGLPDTSKWDYNVGTGHNGWGNNELQYYTELRQENARVENGKLIIEAHREKMEENEYTSARLVSKGKGSWTYGYIEAKAKLPSGRGTWPAIWMMPETSTYGGWPKSGEIDIMEHVGYEPDSIYGTVHTQAFNHMIGTHKVGQRAVKDSESAFHIYAINWNTDKIEFMIDGQVFHTFVNEKQSWAEWPFDQPFYLILNIAVGGGWGGLKGVDSSIYPTQMEVDYVRVYQ